MGTGSENREREPLVLQYKTADGRYQFSLSAFGSQQILDRFTEWR